MEFNKPFRISLKLKDGKSPHLYLVQLKEIMKNDTSLHPMMEKTLKMLKKTRTPFIMLAKVREVIIDSINLRHFDRSAEPRGNWVCTLWSGEEIEQHNKDPEGHIGAMFKLFKALGYEFYNSHVCTLEYVKSLEVLTEKQIEAQMIQKSQEEMEE